MIVTAKFTMCTSEYCSMKDKCYRKLAKPSEYQSWSNFEYTCNEDSGFEDYIKCDVFHHELPVLCGE